MNHRIHFGLSTRTSRALTAGALALSVLAGSSAALAASGPDGSSNTDPAAAASRATSDPLLAAGEPTGTELRFISLPPCRVFDTREAGGKIAGAVRNFTMTGALAGQGGKAAGCGVPAHAKAVQLNLGAISRDGTSGYVSAWAAGTPEPLASLVNFDPSGPVANMVTAALGTGRQISLRVNASADVFADVAGYWTKPLYAFVNATGTIVRGSGAVSATRLAAGQFKVQFERPVQGCAVVGSSQHWDGVQEVSPSVEDGAVNEVHVGIRDAAGNAIDDWFYIALTC